MERKGTKMILLSAKGRLRYKLAISEAAAAAAYDGRTASHMGERTHGGKCPLYVIERETT